jgi:kynurenine formamidase
LVRRGRSRSDGQADIENGVSLEEVLAELRACEWVDLTHAFRPGIPHFHEFPDEQRRELQSHAEHGFQVHDYRHVGQWGTHVDPPVHFIAGGRAVDELPVEEMILPLVVLDVRDEVAADADFGATAATVAAHEAAHGRIPEKSFVALLTGWGSKWPDDDAMRGGGHAPGWDVSGLELLVEERGVWAIGHDTTDTDPAQRVAAGAPAETYILERDRWQIELLANLDRVPARGALIVATWPKPAGGSGFPARCFAIVPSTS